MSIKPRSRHSHPVPGPDERLDYYREATGIWEATVRRRNPDFRWTNGWSRDAVARSLKLCNPAAVWDFDDEAWESFARRGLREASEAMDRLRTLLEARQIDMTLVVYPWPGHFRVRDRGSRHVPHWRDWANRNHVRFVDLFAALVDPASDLETLVEIYIPGDVHFSAEGHRRVAALLMTAGVGGRVPAARTSPE